MIDQRSRRGLGARLALLCVLAVVAVVALSSVPSVARAATDGVTWSVTPATGGQPDARSWVELSLAPGESAREQAAVRNLSTQTVTFRIAAADGYFTDTGRFTMLPSTEKSVDAGTWISAPDSVTVEPGATGIVAFTVTVPDNATPGDHAAGIAASVMSTGTDADGSAVNVESRIGFRVMTRVSGVITASASLENVASDYVLSWNPFQPGLLSLTADVVNTGNVRLRIDGTAMAQGVTAPLQSGDDGEQELLPGERRRVTVALTDIWPVFVVGAELVVTPTAVAPDGVSIAASPVTGSVTVAALPLPQLITLLGAALVLLVLAVARVRARRRVARLVQKARNEGLREGAEAAAGPAT